MLPRNHGAVLLALLLPGCASVPDPDPELWIRINQVGYLPDDPKIAVVSSAQPQSGSFRVGDLVAAIGRPVVCSMTSPSVRASVSIA